ncbi:hemin uptake protein HemP [Lamprobacter modestohalophilus]|nr:hemin uptake protein HemP [Lamprobacter modestohalophilus]MCF8004279.1 hemin uptake protein HemP [Chromatiaceae bacterium]MEA1051716.1 hemin uptake protein HemP [Lamprobacter modestohalophilus]
MHPQSSDKIATGASSAQERRLHSEQLLQGSRRVVIEHGDASYTLLLTRNDKLILVK